MADIEKVRVGDKLRIEVEVFDLDKGDGQFPVEIKPKDSETCWIRRTTVEAAEHIPAPKVFQKENWVRHVACKRASGESGCPLGLGYVLEVVQSGNQDPDQVQAFYAGWESDFSKSQGDQPGVVKWYPANQLEHHEAPEVRKDD